MNIAVELLMQKRDGLLTELRLIEEKYSAEIEELNKAIKELGGDQSWAEINNITRYDDESADYIRGTEDGI